PSVPAERRPSAPPPFLSCTGSTARSGLQSNYGAAIFAPESAGACGFYTALAAHLAWRMHPGDAAPYAGKKVRRRGSTRGRGATEPELEPPSRLPSSTT